MARHASAIPGRPTYRENALSTPRRDVFQPLIDGRQLPVHPTRVAPLTEHPAWAFVGAHGGSGAGLLTRLARQPYVAALTAARDAGQPPIQLPTFAVNAGRAWPAPTLERTGLVVVVCRTTMRGLAWARDVAAQYLSDCAPAGTHLLGVVAIADQPGRLPHPLAAAKGLLTGVYPNTWHLPYIPEYRLLTGLPGDDCPPIHPAVADVLAAIRSTVTPPSTPKGHLA